MKKCIVVALVAAFCLPMIGCAKNDQTAPPVSSGHVTYHHYDGGKLGKLGKQK